MESNLNGEDKIEAGLRKALVAGVPAFAADERDLLRRIALAKKTKPRWGLVAGLSGAAAALLVVLCRPLPAALPKPLSFEEEIVQSFGTGLTDATAVNWGDLSEINESDNKEES